MKLMKDTCSAMNWIMSGYKAKPEVGKGATELCWSDRRAYEVIQVSDDLKKVVIQRYKPVRTDNRQMTESQEYEYKDLENYVVELNFKWGAYRFLDSLGKWSKMNIIFGVRQEYYDYSF